LSDGQNTVDFWNYVYCLSGGYLCPSFAHTKIRVLTQRLNNRFQVVAAQSLGYRISRVDGASFQLSVSGVGALEDGASSKTF
jgi:hypothetical protein